MDSHSYRASLVTRNDWGGGGGGGSGQESRLLILRCRKERHISNHPHQATCICCSLFCCYCSPKLASLDMGQGHYGIVVLR